MPSCSVKSCKNNYRNVKNSGIRLHRFPRNKEARQKWGEFCSRKLNFANARICSVHFDEQCYERKPDYLTAPGDTSVLRLKETAVPTKLLYEDEAVSPKHEDNKGLETRSCVVFGCGNNSTISDPSIDYYAFPKNELSQEWATACGWQSTRLDFETAYVCSMHFEELDFEEEITILDCMTCYSKKLKEDAVPTLCLPLEQVMVKENPLELQTQDMLVYTIDSSNIIVKENSTTMSLESASGNQQIFELGAFSSEIKAEEAQVKSDIRDPIYGSSKSFSHLYCLQEDNESLKRTVEVLQEEVDQLQKSLEEKKKLYEEYEKQCKIMETKATNNHVASQQEQKELLSKVFSEAQIKILLGGQRSVWSNDDMAVAYTIRHLSNRKFYSYVSQRLHIPLPGMSTIQRWVCTKNMKKNKL